MVARDIMTKDLITVKTDTPVTEIAKLMATNGISGVPVLDYEGRLVGIVTENDLLLNLAKSKSHPRLALFGLWIIPDDVVENAYKDARNKVVAADVMTKNVVTFSEDDSIEKIAAEMVKRGINRVPIMRDCKLVGIVSREDILRAIAMDGVGN
ncbi:MAG: CBS domain-containing protein [Armatimonadota bacterium]